MQLAEIQRHVAERLRAPVGSLVMIVKSATIYETEVGLMSEALASAHRERAASPVPAAPFSAY